MLAVLNVSMLGVQNGYLRLLLICQALAGLLVPPAVHDKV
jgi:hypothetical protein